MGGLRINTLAVALAVTLLFSNLAAASLSSAQVTESMGAYLSKGEAVQLLVDAPFDIDGYRYWVGFTYLEASPSSRNNYLVVDDNTGAMVFDSDELKKVFATVAEYNAVKYLEDNGLSPNDLSVFLSTEQNKLEAGRANYRTIVTNQLADRYDSFDFSPIETALEAVEARHGEARDAVNGLFEQRQTFRTFYSNLDLASYQKAYNESFQRFSELSRAAKSYQQATRDKIDEATNSATLNFSQKQELKDGLERLFISQSEYESFYKTTVEPTANKMSSDLTANRIAAAGQAESTRYVIAKKDAERAYTAGDTKSLATQLLSTSRTEYLTACGISTDALRTAWIDVRSVMENPSNASIDAYREIPVKMQAVATNAQSVNSQLESCTNAPTTGGSAGAKKPDYSLLYWFAGIAIVVLAAVYLYRRWRQAQLEAGGE